MRRQQDAETGDIVVAAIDEDEATVKTLRKRRGKAVLLPANPLFTIGHLDRLSVQQLSSHAVHFKTARGRGTEIRPFTEENSSNLQAALLVTPAVVDK